MPAEERAIPSVWADTLLQRLREHGVRDLCLAPGSRSAPLALAAGRCLEAGVGLRVHTHFDERGLGFYALGLSRATGRPTALITTSGTAVPNLHPALTEAAESHVPLIAVTADRPPELHGCGANQTIQQPGVFAAQCRSELRLPAPDPQLGTAWLCRRIDAALAPALAGADGGPVHINAPFREPLYAPPAQPR
ncbi:thiamine pyrophosphate-binding protein, partial [Halorhodospira neutriphila]|nr:2-succinyl-5-enolpyruvyl-6-hydroxy-3-cyclohexene-1-carboxylate synthase [Halorhodospira neutriphila]